MKQKATYAVSATLHGIMVAVLVFCVMGFLCSVINPKAMDDYPVLLGIFIWGIGLALGIARGRVVWKKRR